MFQRGGFSLGLVQTDLKMCKFTKSKSELVPVFILTVTMIRRSGIQSTCWGGNGTATLNQCWSTSPQELPGNRDSKSWEEGLLPGAATHPDTLNALVYEKAAAETIAECTEGHFVNSVNLDLVCTENYSSFEQPFKVHGS
ncbi:Glutamyl-trna reductase [Lasiodiplodia theobromae]|uniref:Glutamyl-trna reductase n=1 Tax=Lasiodiplodia theobromae TaxID=45133 RepID=UPI0015C38D37|nr:Glutamyl-trna reductase [Lasiodiplodia theobromae]KAF4539381.1 Glutamyl-trna reductase [Lasiodiplodia theobromae]